MIKFWKHTKYFIKMSRLIRFIYIQFSFRIHFIKFSNPIKHILLDWCFWTFLVLYFQTYNFYAFIDNFGIYGYLLNLSLFIGFMVFGDDLWGLIKGNFRIIIYYFILEDTSVTFYFGKIENAVGGIYR